MSSRRLDADQAIGREGFRGCGIGEGADCCAYLTSDSGGFSCEQRSALAHHLRQRVHAGLMNARRLPRGEFPACQAEGRSR